MSQHDLINMKDRQTKLKVAALQISMDYSITKVATIFDLSVEEITLTSFKSTSPLSVSSNVLIQTYSALTSFLLKFSMEVLSQRRLLDGNCCYS